MVDFTAESELSRSADLCNMLSNNASGLHFICILKTLSSSFGGLFSLILVTKTWLIEPAELLLPLKFSLYMLHFDSVCFDLNFESCDFIVDIFCLSN